MSQTTSPPAATDAGTGPAAQAKEKASDVAGQAQEKTQAAAEQAKSRLRSQVDERSTQAGQKVTTTAGDIRAIGEQLHAQGKDGPGKLADQAAERAEKVGGYLRDSDPDRILADAEDFARRRPWAVVAGGLAVGFAASRFLKASSSERYRSSAARRPSGQPAIAGPTRGNGHATYDVYGAGELGTGMPPVEMGPR